MLKTFIFSAAVFWTMVSTSSGWGQALPTATANGRLQAGVGITYGSPDYAPAKIAGASGFIDFDFTQHIGVEANIHYVALNTPDDIAENSYNIGPRFSMTYGRFTPYAKVLIGIGDVVLQEQQDTIGRSSGTYLMYGAGGGIDVIVTRHIFVRAIDLEYQRWPNFGNGLTPIMGTIGAGYRFR